jgi:hypothetical protein
MGIMFTSFGNSVLAHGSRYLPIRVCKGTETGERYGLAGLSFRLRLQLSQQFLLEDRIEL